MVTFLPEYAFIFVLWQVVQKLFFEKKWIPPWSIHRALTVVEINQNIKAKDQITFFPNSHGSENKLVTFMGMLQALVSIIECDGGNKLYHVIAGDHKIVFLHKNYLIFVCVSSEPDKSIEQLNLELEYVYSQIISTVTLTLIEKIFKSYPNYDIRKKLSGTEKLITNIIKRFHNDYGMLLNCVNSYPLRFETREQIARMLAQNISSIKFVLFGLLLFDNKLVAIIRPKTKNIHPVDVHLLVNVITGLDHTKSSEFIQYPICLPNFNSTGKYGNEKKSGRQGNSAHSIKQSNLVNPALLLSGNLLFRQNFLNPEFFIIPIHVSKN